MFTKAALSLLLIARVLATPVDVSAPSFNNWNGISSLSGFDDFNGRNNFDGRNNEQIIVIQQQEVVCKRVQIEVIQQKLVILQEMAKRIITEQVCEVETQTIILEQFQSSMGRFGSDVSRKSGKQVGYDSNIANQISKIVDSNGQLSGDNLGFNGGDVGKNTVVPSGNNWNDNSGPAAVKGAKDAAKKASKASGKPSASASASVDSSSSTSAAESTSTSESAESTSASESAEATSSAASESAEATSSAASTSESAQSTSD